MDRSGGGSLGDAPAVALDAPGLARYWGAVAMEGTGIPVACSAGVVTLEKIKPLFNGSNCSTGEVVTTPTVVGGFPASAFVVSVADPPWVAGNGSGRGVLKTKIF